MISTICSRSLDHHPAAQPAKSRDLATRARDGAERRSSSDRADQAAACAVAAAKQAPPRIELNGTVRSFHKLLSHALGARHALSLKLDAREIFVFIEPAQLFRILLNLVINARDALTSKSNRVNVEILGPERAAAQETRSFAAYAVITVADDGTGMSEETRRRARDPFFSQKPTASGSGLGLAVCRSLTAQAGGRFTLESTLGKGTTARVYLPVDGTPTPLP